MEAFGLEPLPEQIAAIVDTSADVASAKIGNILRDNWRFMTKWVRLVDHAHRLGVLTPPPKRPDVDGGNESPSPTPE